MMQTLDTRSLPPARRRGARRRAPVALGVLLAAACSERDYTQTLSVGGAPVRPTPTDSGVERPDLPGALDAAPPQASGDAGVETPVEPAGADAGLDAGSDSGPELPQCVLAPPVERASNDAGAVAAGECLLEADWSVLQVDGPADCSALSSAFQARWFRWGDGALASLDPAAAPFASAGTTLERLRFCPRAAGDLSELWRFEEAFELGGSLPGSGCPGQPFQARYRYAEHPEVAGTGLVFGDSEPSACRFEACVVFTPRAATTAADAPSASESECYGSGLFEPTRSVPLGEHCIADECVAGSFCSLELPDGTCAPAGDGTCQEAPLLETCSADGEPVCTCFRTTPLTGTNACRERARGVSTRACQ